MSKLLYITIAVVIAAFYLRPSISDGHVLKGNVKWEISVTVGHNLALALNTLSKYSGKHMYHTFLRGLGTTPEPHTDVAQSTIVPEDAPYEITRYVPTSIASQKTRKTLIYLHGGGMVIGLSPLGQLFARHTGYQVFGIEYRLAPEHPYPAGVDDSIAGIRHLLQNKEKYGIGEYGIYGMSAGGYLALVTTMGINFKEEFGSMPQFTVPVIPMTQMLRFDLPSQQSFDPELPVPCMVSMWLGFSGMADMYDQKKHALIERNLHLHQNIRTDEEFMSRIDPTIWSKETLPVDYVPVKVNDRDFRSHPAEFINKLEKLARDPMFQPGLADEAHLKRICGHVGQVRIVVGGVDTLRDDGIMMANRLKSVCENVSLDIVKGVGHMFPYGGSDGPLAFYEEYDEGVATITRLLQLSD